MADPASPATAAAEGRSYRVLARKYRPMTLSQLIGQDVLVRTLANAFKTGRLAQAYMLTGVRGVGKTTTARIIARALNCVGPDGTGGPTPEPCGVCEHCVAIARESHLDVIEQDAASRTGVDDIRELLDGVRYRPTSARSKVYIIDEVHMLSKNAFNALLKTLEEPPSHVTFIFATTEIRKVPVTVLSRCQRFDLRRIDEATLTAHFASIASQENATLTPAALALLARAADGSVRDGLSLLDRAISYVEGPIDEATLRGMMGLVDRSVTFELFESVLGGRIETALSLLQDQYFAGADPAAVLEDLLALTHWLTRTKIAPSHAETPNVPEAERVRGRALAEALPMAALARTWQMLLKGLEDVRMVSMPILAAEMTLIRLAYTAQLPTPAEVLGEPLAPGTTPSTLATPLLPIPSTGTLPRETGVTGLRSPRSPTGGPEAALARPLTNAAPAETPRLSPAAAPDEAPAPARPDDPRSFAAVVQLAAEHAEGILYGHLMASAHLVHFEPGRIDVALDAHAPADLAQRLSRFLNTVTHRRWLVSVVQGAGEASLYEQQQAEEARLRAEIERHPAFQSLLAAFPGSRILEVGRTDTEATPTADESCPDQEPPEAADTSEAEDADGSDSIPAWER